MANIERASEHTPSPWRATRGESKTSMPSPGRVNWGQISTSALSPGRATRGDSSSLPLTTELCAALEKMRRPSDEEVDQPAHDPEPPHQLFHSESSAERLLDEIDPSSLLARADSDAIIQDVLKDLVGEYDALIDQVRTTEAPAALYAAARERMSCPTHEIAERLQVGPPAEQVCEHEPQAGAIGTLHRPCATCREARVKCDYLQPCTRCVRLGCASTCQPPPNVKRGRPATKMAGRTAAAQSDVSGSGDMVMERSDAGPLPTASATGQLSHVAPADEHPRHSSARGSTSRQSARRSWHAGQA